ncbi:hypothetical protein CXJ51_003663 [Escherichia coli]|nr:hypothetical protein [Escherichia coli]EMB0261342.1 hypothetical protein [Escherichia coli]
MGRNDLLIRTFLSNTYNFFLGFFAGTTAAWRLQIGVWQNMNLQGNHPE